jgi:serine/threonine-protein kinase RsbW
MGTLEFNFLSDLPNVKCAILKSTSFVVSNTYLTQEEQYDFKLIFTELLGNSFIHGNKYDATKKINVLIELNNNYISVTISDEGTGIGFDISTFLDTSNYKFNLSSENNRGLYLVKALTDSLTFKNNSVKFIKSVTVYE